MTKYLLPLACVGAVFAASVFAQNTTPDTAQPVSASTIAPAPIAPATSINADLRAGTPVSFAMMEEVTTKKKAAKVGQRLQLEVAAPIEVNGVVIIPAGTPA
ncbi:hypothetical protein [Novosphingopyxis sp.]|uniref:hypothetical protein n=1 Tax=Novosphingopyxis sp. TaxID=2709690 RepID=UPI003B5939D0